MFQTMLVTGVTALQSKDEMNHWKNQQFVDSWPETTNRKPVITRNRTIKKKHKRVRTAFTTEQLRALEKTFLINKYINSDHRRELSKQLCISEKSIKIWFQNRRMKEKRVSSEFGDSSNESIGQKAIAPTLDRKLESEIENVNIKMYNDQCPNTGPYYVNYQVPAAQAYYVMDPHNQYEPQNNDFTPNIGAFYNETNPYPTHYYPSGETETYQINAYQNHYQQNNEIYWYQNNMDSYNYSQY